VALLVFSLRSTAVLVLSTALLLPSAFASHIHRPPTSGKSKASQSKTGGKATSKTKSQNGSAKTSGKSSKRKSSYRRVRGQREIDSERATQIQQALIREHYLTGDPTGTWDANSIAAMKKYQSDQGWQTKLTPDSRALNKLGLGPDYSTAINAKTGNFVPPPPPASSIPTEQVSGFASAAGVNQ
jgi:hypothetical protein